MSWLSEVWKFGPGWLLGRFTWIGWLVPGPPLLNWKPPADLGFQMAHFFAASWAVLMLDKGLGLNWFVTAAIVLILAGVKEFIVDVKVIEGDSYLRSSWDFLWYFLGVAVNTHFIRHPLL